MIVAIAGQEKVGKTHFSLTAPKPMVVYNFDMGLDGAVGRFKGQDIDSLDFPLPIMWSEKPKDVFTPLWEKFIKAYLLALEGKPKPYQTLVIDTATQLWEIIRMHHFEEMLKANPERTRMKTVEYAVPNSRMRSVINAAKNTGQHLILTHYVRDVYEDDKKTGAKEPDAFRYTGGLADINLSVKLEEKQKKQVTVVEIDNCRFDRSLRGQKMYDPTWADLAQVVGQ